MEAIPGLMLPLSCRGQPSSCTCRVAAGKRPELVVTPLYTMATMCMVCLCTIYHFPAANPA